MSSKSLLITALLSFSIFGQSHAQQADWDIAADHGQTKTVSFTTSEGTWMNLDVNPDGREIVFDMLGDIYIMSINGGKARLVSGGPAFEVQPRFSPDGSQISFTSDRAGGDNIWIMDKDGTDPKQITNESFRLLNNAVWNPDGEYIVAKKHFTSARSLGAGEMWMYHTSGELSGIQLTKRKNDQQDVGMPAFSPDGKFLYFSEDMSGGTTFQYNKDPYGQIFSVRRLNMHTGQLISLTGGAGGATKPELSPDGKYLSFVRRVRLESVLYIRDLKSGAEWPVYDKLSKDQQEAWAIFGTYPNYSWTPDSKNIVIWAKGNLMNINVETKSARQIPFEVDASLKVTEAVHYEHEVSPSRFESKMIRNTVTSPNGNWIVFNSAGNIWKKRLPEGVPARITRDAHKEFFPSFSPDGNSIVYIAWSDKELGAIYTANLANGVNQKITKDKGYYYSPSYSNDGSKILYRRGGGDFILGNIHSNDPGIYWTDTAGAEHHKLRNSGGNPRFNSDDTRVYFTQGKSLRSVNLDNKDERTHFTSKYARSFIPSPDDKWIAFTELFNVYIAPFPKVAVSVDLSANMRSIPVKRVTKNAGDYLHWSRDSQKLHWTLGPEYFTRDLKNTFDFAGGDGEEIREPEETGLKIDLYLQTDVPTGKLAIDGARIITMRGNEVIENGTIIIEGNRITAIGQAGSVTIPSDATRINASGKTVMPGIVDAHAHIGNSFNLITPDQQWSYYANLAYGVTTSHDPSTNTEMIFSQAEMLKAGKLVGPRLYSTGTILYGAEGDFKAVVNTYEDALSHLKRMKAVGAISVKSYNQPRRNQRQQILKAARELEMLVVPEGGSTFTHNISQVIDGHTGIEHNVPIAPLYNDVLSLWGNTNVGYTPTLVVSYGGLSGEYYWYQKTNVWEKKRLLNFTPRSIIDSRSRRRQMVADNDYGHIEVAKSVKALLDRGVSVQVGAHGQLQGLAAHWEFWMFAQGGMTELEAIRSATLNGAKYLGLDKSIGSLENGKLADLVILNSNPLINIRNTEDIQSVMVNGRLYDAETMNEIGNHPKKRDLFYWENPLTNEAFILDNLAMGRSGLTCGCFSKN